jgi:hypothetical protein
MRRRNQPVNRTSPADGHDPYWGLDGKSASRARHQRQFVRWGVRLVAILALAVLVTRLPAIDATVIFTPAGRPILAGAIFSLLAACMLLGLARMRSTDRS